MNGAFVCSMKFYSFESRNIREAIHERLSCRSDSHRDQAARGHSERPASPAPCGRHDSRPSGSNPRSGFGCPHPQGCRLHSRRLRGRELVGTGAETREAVVERVVRDEFTGASGSAGTERLLLLGVMSTTWPSQPHNYHVRLV